MNTTTPRISVLLPVFNGAPYLAEAIDSVLAQSHADFELLILNDGSKDDSAAVAKRFTDPRIRYFEHPNMGLPATLNEGARHARGEFLFRQDQDDLCHPERFARQLAWLDAHPDVALLGTWARIFVDGDPQAAPRYHRHPESHASIALCTIFDTAFVHSSVAIRRHAFEAIGGYNCDPMRQPPEDFELWSRMCRRFHVANLPEVLLDYREVTGSMSRAPGKDFIQRIVMISAENLHHWLHGSPYEAFSDKLAHIYRLDGAQPTVATDRAMIDAALRHIRQAMAIHGDVNDPQYLRQWRRLRHRLLRNHWLGRFRRSMPRLAVKAIFRVMGKLHG